MLRTVATLAAGGLGGALASWAGSPLPWLIGSLITTAAIAFSGLRPQIPPSARKIGQMIAALAIGATFSPPVLETLASFIHIMILAAVASIAAGVLTALILSKISGTSFDTCYFASLPGGVAEMSVLVERYGGDTSLVAVSQSLRIILVVLTVPVGITMLSGGSVATNDIDFSSALHIPSLLGLLVAATAISFVLDRARIMNSWFLAGLTVGILVALVGVPVSPVPVPLLDLAQVLIGCALGSRIDKKILGRLKHFLPATMLGTGALVIFNIGAAWLISLWLGAELSPLVLATAPGGVAEMSITANALQLAAPLVTAFHLVRIVMIVTLSAPIYQATARIRARFTAHHPAE